MEKKARLKDGPDRSGKPGQFEGKFLLAMPNIGSGIFDRSIIYLCAHSHDGAMGFQINKDGDMTLNELMLHTNLETETDATDQETQNIEGHVRDGGPVDEHRGFVLHSGDYHSDDTIPICADVFLTSNVEILRSIRQGKGPARIAIALGYSGWGPGQLEQEIADNAWLTLDANAEIVFSSDHAGKYDQLLDQLGINQANLVTDSGRA